MAHDIHTEVHRIGQQLDWAIAISSFSTHAVLLDEGAFSICYCSAAQAMKASAAMKDKLSPSVSTSFSRRTSLSRSHCSILSANFPAEDFDALLDMYPPCTPILCLPLNS